MDKLKLLLKNIFFWTSLLISLLLFGETLANNKGNSNDNDR